MDWKFYVSIVFLVGMGLIFGLLIGGAGVYVYTHNHAPVVSDTALQNEYARGVFDACAAIMQYQISNETELVAQCNKAGVNAATNWYFEPSPGYEPPVK